MLVADSAALPTSLYLHAGVPRVACELAAFSGALR